MMQKMWDAVVIGGGPAGLSTAQALGRSLRRVLVIDAGVPRNRFASHMHNVLGLDGLSPAELNARGRAEAERYGVEFREASVKRVSDEVAGLRVELGGGEELVTRSLIVATGITDQLPEIPGLAECWGKTVLHCPYCHGWEVRGQRIAVIATSPLSVHQMKLVRQLSEHVVAFTAGAGDIDEQALHLLRARGIQLEEDPVTEVIHDSGRVSAVRTVTGREIPVDAIFTAATMLPHDGFLDGLDLDRAENPMGSFISVDTTGRTSHPRIWAAGNVVSPAASVPIAAGAGNFAGAAANAMLVEEDFETADRREPRLEETPAAFWERRYGDAGPVWTGHVNRSLADIVAPWDPGTSLDLGCGEGGDVLWLAEQGWRASGIDLSLRAIERARAAAAERGLAQARFEAQDLSDWLKPGDEDPERYDLVTASFFQSPAWLPRPEILRAAADRVAPGGHLVIVAHAAPPAGSHNHHRPDMEFPTPEGDLAALELDPERWAVEAAEVRDREITTPDGQAMTLGDSVVVVRRL